MSETYGTTGMQNDDTTRELGSLEQPHSSLDAVPAVGQSTYGSTGASGYSDTSGSTDSSDTKQVAKDEAMATGQQAKQGAQHVAEVGKDEVKNVAAETGQQAKELWEQTRTQLMDQSAQQQTKVAEGLRSLSEELSSMARGSEQQGVATDLAQQASQRVGDVAGWLDQRDPGSLVTELKQFARQRPGAFLGAAAVLGLVGGRLSRGLVADHQDQQDATSPSNGTSGETSSVAYGTSGYAAPSPVGGTGTPVAGYPVTDTLGEGNGAAISTGPIAGTGPITGTGQGELPR